MNDLRFTGERIVPEADNCEPTFAKKMYQEHIARYRFAAQVVRGRNVLDIGCGVGYGSRFMMESGANRIVALDVSEDAIAHARRHYAAKNLEFTAGSAEDWSSGERFDVITCFEVIEHVVDYRKVFDRIVQALKPSGLLFVSTPRALEQKRSDFHTKEFSPEEFERELSDRFSHVRFFFQNNHFSSLIADRGPESIRSVARLNEEQFQISRADYFIAVASIRRDVDKLGLREIVVLNDDKYVLNLERDVSILHHVERSLSEDRETLQGEVLSLRGDLESHSKERENLRGEVLSLRGDLKSNSEERQILRGEILSLRAELESLHRANIAISESRNSLLERLQDAERWRESLSAACAAAERAQAQLGQEFRFREDALQAKLDESEHSRIRAEAQARDAASQREDALHDRELAEKGWAVEREELARESRNAIATAGVAREVANAQAEALQQRILEEREKFLELEARFVLEASSRRRAEGDLRILSEEVRDIRSTASWRLTAPLRELKQFTKPAWSIGSRAWSHYRRFGIASLLTAALSRIHRVPRPATSEVFRELSGIEPSRDQASASASITTLTSTDRPAAGKGRAAEAPDAARVEIFIGCWEGESKRYRATNVAEALESVGIKARTFDFRDIRLLVEERRRPEAVIIFRAPFHVEFGIERVIQYARSEGIRLVFDIDDLVFDPDLVSLIDGFRLLSQVDRKQYLEGVEGYRRLLLECDSVSVTTPFLAAEVGKLGKPTCVVRNSLNKEQLTIAEQLLARKGLEGGPQVRSLVIGYFSGSRTHQRDFDQASDALFRVLKTRKEARFLLVGFLELGPQWDELKDQVERKPFVSASMMMELMATCDINLAPLEIGNPFCEAKSELKYFEAALVEVPTVASRTEVFRDAITDGVTGFLASNPDEWRSALETLLERSELRRRIGASARAHVLGAYGPANLASQTMSSLGIQSPLKNASMLRRGNMETPLRIDWIVPGIIIGGGGHRNIFRAAYFLERFGHRVTLHIAQTDSPAAELRETVRRHFYPFEGTVRRYDGAIAETDVVFATHWTTVDAAVRARSAAREVMYFVQDFEPAFAPMGTEYVLAENTYRLGLYHVTSGPWCERILREQFSADADHFQFPVDRSVYYPRPANRGNSRIVFFAKPEMPRRCYELGLMALREIKKLRPSVEIVMFGSKNVEKARLGFEATTMDILPTLDSLADLYSCSTMGIAFSTTNPSLVPYEMMACGLPVVDLDRSGNEVNYGDRRDIALLANPLPEIMASQVIALLDDPRELERRSHEGIRFVEGFPTEEQMARRIEELILRRLHGSESAARGVETAKGAS